MNATYEQLISFLDEREVRYISDHDGQSVCADFHCEVGVYRIIIHVDENAELFQIFGYAPNRVPEGSLQAIAETVTRANCGLRVGKFELDLDQREVRFQASQILTEGGLDDMIIDRLISSTLEMLDTYLPAVLSVIYGNELPKDAIHCVEARHCGRDLGDTDDGAEQE